MPFSTNRDSANFLGWGVSTASDCFPGGLADPNLANQIAAYQRDPNLMPSPPATPGIMDEATLRSMHRQLVAWRDAGEPRGTLGEKISKCITLPGLVTYPSDPKDRTADKDRFNMVDEGPNWTKIIAIGGALTTLGYILYRVARPKQ